MNDSVLFCSTGRRKGDFLLAGLKYTKHPNQKDFNGETLLHRVSRGLNTDSIVLQAIIDAGGEVDARDRYGSSPVLDAMIVGDFSSVLQLLNGGADPRLCRGGLAAFKRVFDGETAKAKDNQYNDALKLIDPIKKLVAKFSESDSD